MRPSWLEFAEQSTPRYTSYPTAPHFNPSVNSATFRAWLGELASDALLSVYLHTPYCKQMCWYCGCHALAAKRDGPLAEFVDTLLCEIDLVGGATPARRIGEIHWGGGTPNILSPARFCAIIRRLGERFDLTSLQRHAVEIDPRLMTAAHAEVFADVGVNRASLGVQDLDPGVQASIGRVQPFEVVADAAAILRAAGIEDLSFDLMYGLPQQTRETVRRTAERAASLRPARLSVFGYAHVPWFKARQRLMNEAELPGTAARYDLADTIRETLFEAGYVAIGYDHFALPTDPIAVAAKTGALTRNFQGFVEEQCDALVGLGPSAVSTLPQGYAQNEPEVGAWRGAVTSGGFATKRGFALTAEDRRRRELIMRLLCDFRLDLGPFGGLEAFKPQLLELSPLASAGLVEIEGNVLTIPHEARPLARLVAQAFDAYRSVGAARHSRAV
ncbi:MAG: oxygen-independent coproporphyrinogen III oxidase [Hyphomonadaceae bacterium]|nr:oxygen-independent coproporphyrinogen III oxidase [Hyphomonadaceae bacterium]